MSNKERQAVTNAEQRTNAEVTTSSHSSSNTNVVRRLNVVFLDIDGVLNTPENACKR